MRHLLNGLIALSLSLGASHAGLLDTLGLGKKDTNQTTSAAALPQDQVAQGLKQALGKGVQQAVSRLGHDGGFLNRTSWRMISSIR